MNVKTLRPVKAPLLTKKYSAKATPIYIMTVINQFKERTSAEQEAEKSFISDATHAKEILCLPVADFLAQRKTIFCHFYQ